MTRNKGTWALNSNYAKHGDEKVYELSPSEPRVIQIEPQLPYLYIPEKDFMQFALATVSKFGTHDVRCSNNFYHRCIF